MKDNVKLTPPAHWDVSSANFLLKITSISTVPVDNTSFWLKDASNFAIPAAESKEQSLETVKFLKNLASQLSLNGSITQNLQSSFFHCLIQMRYLKILDFSLEPKTELCGLFVATSILLKAIFDVGSFKQLDHLFKDKEIHKNSISIISEKYNSFEDPQIYAHSVQQLTENTQDLFTQFIEYTVLCLCKIDPSKSYNSQFFVHNSILLLIDLLKSQIYNSEQHIDLGLSNNYFLAIFFKKIAFSRSFNCSSTLADLLISSLLLMISTPKQFVASYGTYFYSAYISWVHGQNLNLGFDADSLRSKAFFLLSLLITQPHFLQKHSDWKFGKENESLPSFSVNSFFSSITSVESQKSSLSNQYPSFSLLFDTLISDFSSDDNIFLFSFLVLYNVNFREFCIARSDSETLLLKALLALSDDMSKICELSSKPHSKEKGTPELSVLPDPSPLQSDFNAMRIDLKSDKKIVANLPSSDSTKAQKSPASEASGDPKDSLNKIPSLELELKYFRVHCIVSSLFYLSSDYLFVSNMSKSSVDYKSWMHPSCQSRGITTVNLSVLFVSEVLECFSRNFNNLKDHGLNNLLLLCLSNVFDKVSCIPPKLADRVMNIYEIISKHLLKMLSSINKIFELGGPGYQFLVSMSLNEGRQKTENDQNKLLENESRILSAKFDKLDDRLCYILSRSVTFFNLDEFVVYSDIHYIFSLFILKSVYTSPDKNIYLLYELVRKKSILMNVADPNTIANLNKSSLLDNLDLSSSTIELRVSSIIKLLIQLVEFIIGSINGKTFEKLPLPCSSTADLPSLSQNEHSQTKYENIGSNLHSTHKGTLSSIKTHCASWNKLIKDVDMGEMYKFIDFYELKVDPTSNPNAFHWINKWAWCVGYSKGYFVEANYDPKMLSNLIYVLSRK
ncbi:hypothetical protein BB560_006730 [Smittium megazygosporum]|uniref:Dymeclin n=1 Tax=Smittium megazygosporum TaxID=133381 RepID=A0A2T9Y231_9FUNG|nr:hypothetical protein BB560_006730 [Smittium megazygosporum]